MEDKTLIRFSDSSGVTRYGEPQRGYENGNRVRLLRRPVTFAKRGRNRSCRGWTINADGWDNAV